MGTRYIELNAAEFEAFFSVKGFTRTVSGNEVVLIRRHDRDARLMVKIYTSIAVGSSVGRSCGDDAIRIVAVFDDGKRSFGISKEPRVYRTGSNEKVQERTLERARSAYADCNEWLKRNQ